MHTCAIVVAAGSGSRFGAPKQFVSLRGAPVVHRAVAASGAACEGVVVVLPAGRDWDGPEVIKAVPGGDTRAESVRCGLEAVPAACEIVVVHDAARPLAAAPLFAAVIGAVEAGADAAIPVLPIPDTVKRIEGNTVVETLDRSGLVAVQTPQAFRAEALRSAHATGGEATDDAALVESVGGHVQAVPGDSRNLKITTAMDLELAMALLGGGDGA